jgi:hypothetical protein
MYDASGALVGVRGILASGGYPSYFNRQGQRVFVEDPVLTFLGGTTGSIVVGNQLWYLRATTSASAITSVTPAPAEDLWQGGSPPQTSMTVALPSTLIGATPNIAPPGACRAPVPKCTTSTGQPGHQTCDFDSGTWTGGCEADGPPPSVTVGVFAPNTFKAPLGTYASFRGSVYDPIPPYDNSGTWTAPAGSGRIVQSGNDVRFYPYNLGQTILTLRSNTDPTKSVTATVTAPTGIPLADIGSNYPGEVNNCVQGDSGMKACTSGQTYHHNLIFYNDRGARTDYLNCGIDTGDFFAPASGCYINDHPGPGVGVSVNANFYFSTPGNHLTILLYPLSKLQWNVGHVDVKAWRLFFGGGVNNDGTPKPPPSPLPVVAGVDDVVGVCAVHSATGNLVVRTGQDRYLNGCRTQ